jgi:hypothetical protein
MARAHLAVAALLLACAATNPSDASDTDGSADATLGESEASSEPTTTGITDDPTTSASTTDPSTSASESESEGESTDTTGPEPPLPEGICNEDGACSFPETCSTCPDECGSCDVEDFPEQRAKYVDQACGTAGDGLSDRCAAADGGPGRFNDLQVALESLVGGDTLYVHPGDYWRPGEPFVVSGTGTREAPIFVTAAVPDQPPTLHSWDPADPTNNDLSHEALFGGGEFVVLDGVRIDGMTAFSGEQIRVQNVECTHGWEECDGNWSCIRLEWCNDCNVHHNWVHDVVDVTNHCDGDWEPREAGFKEFDCQRAIWEFNTVEDTALWGYDLHRSSTDALARFNLFRNIAHVAIRMNRTGNIHAYGNAVLGAGVCIDYVNEDAGDGFANVVDHNTCLFVGSGIAINPFAPTTVTGNVLGGLAPGGTEAINIAAPDPEDGVPHEIDRNAYDANSQWVTQMYEATYATTLAQWQDMTEYDDNSVADAGGACSLVDAPTDADDAEFDLTIADGPCATLDDRGGPAGACALTSCLGHACAGCGF